jgi:hypothetical protein
MFRPFLYEKRSSKLPRQAQDKHLQGGLLLSNRGGVLFLQGERGGRPWQHTAAEHFQPAAATSADWCEKLASFLSFPYVCPEPVLAK